MNVRLIQKALVAKGFNPGQIDGIMGPKTEAAIVAFKKSKGLRPRPYIGPITYELLVGKSTTREDIRKTATVPWVNELGKYLGKHERRDNSLLRRWLRSDGKTLGDPKKFPWCGDAMETAIKLTLPTEPFKGNLGLNPYLARNWLEFGMKSDLAYGVMVVLWRGKKNGTSGHICTAIGYDPIRKRIRVRGGNQSNTVSDTWVKESRVLGYRKPITYKGKLPNIPIMNSKGQVVSSNEA